jgi:Glycosyltransferase sugar-binding region containing DXD motif
MTRPGSPLLIPKILHQIWLGDSKIPQALDDYRQSWKKNQPDWDCRLWTEHNLPRDLRPEVYELLRSPVERSDILRIELIHRFGGIYADLDVESIRPLTPLIGDTCAFAGYVHEGVLSQWLFGAVPGHSAIADVLERLDPQQRFGPYDPSAGTDGRLFTEVLREHKEVTIFDIGVFFQPYKSGGTHAPSSAVVVHHGTWSWARETRDGAVARLEVVERHLAVVRGELARYEGETAIAAYLDKILKLRLKLDERRLKLAKREEALGKKKREIRELEADVVKLQRWNAAFHLQRLRDRVLHRPDRRRRI